MRLPNLPVALIFQATCLVTLVSGARNISIDDQNMALFQYTGNWTRIPSTMDKEGGHMMTQSQDAYATITYTCASSIQDHRQLWTISTTRNHYLFPPLLSFYFYFFGGINVLKRIIYLQSLPYTLFQRYGLTKLPLTMGSTAVLSKSICRTIRKFIQEMIRPL